MDARRESAETADGASNLFNFGTDLRSCVLNAEVTAGSRDVANLVAEGLERGDFVARGQFALELWARRNAREARKVRRGSIKPEDS
jgi:hypothetical protein